MADSNPNQPRGPAKVRILILATLIAASLLSAPRRAGAAVQGTAAPIALDAQSSELDLKNNNVFFRKVRIAQGNMSVTADQGQASR
jgi:lipopolysaccharide export system protein LptA